MNKFKSVLSDVDFMEILSKTNGFSPTSDGEVYVGSGDDVWFALADFAEKVEQATIAALKEQQEEQHKKDKFFFDVVDSIMFKSLLAMQCALIEAHQNGDAKKALENWVETMIDQFGDDFSEHYTDVTVSADEYHKQQMGKRNG